MTGRLQVKVTQGALEDAPGGKIILRGVMDADNLHKLQTADYQKKTHSAAKLQRLGHAVVEGSRLPDIELGMRGENFTSETTVDGVDNFVLHDPVYIIDGLQRSLVMRGVKSRYPQLPCVIGVIVHFDTDEAWERKRFEALATDRTPVAPSVILRNAAKDNHTAYLIYSMTKDKPSSLLHNRVTWDQHQVAGEIVLGSTVYRTAILLHSWAVAPGTRRPHEMVAQVDEITKRIGHSVFIANIERFFDLVDHYWGFRDIQKRDGVVQVRADFLYIVAELMAELRVFWEDSTLCDSNRVRRLKPRLEITPQIRDWLAPNKNSHDAIKVFYKTQLNKNLQTKLIERPLATKSTRGAA